VPVGVGTGVAVAVGLAEGRGVTVGVGVGGGLFVGTKVWVDCGAVEAGDDVGIDDALVEGWAVELAVLLGRVVISTVWAGLVVGAWEFSSDEIG
jgi:hypothetical protein